MTTLSVPPCDAMIDIIKQLRNGINTRDFLNDCIDYKFLCEEAADYIEALEKEIGQYNAAAERYFWLREQQWYNSDMCVVINPKAQLKLGTDCPILDRLDTLIDEARGKK